MVFLQRKLKVRGTGHFGPATRAAVKRYEKAHHLPADGVIAGSDWRWIGRPQHVAMLSARVAPRVSRSDVRTVPGSPEFGSQVLDIAADYRGAPYAHGGTGPAFDCSGFVGTVFSRLGYDLPRSAAAMRAATPRISADDVRPGDLVFVYNGGGGRVGHVAIYAGPGSWWESSQPGTPVGKRHAWSSRVSYGRVG